MGDAREVEVEFGEGATHVVLQLLGRGSLLMEGAVHRGQFTAKGVRMAAESHSLLGWLRGNVAAITRRLQAP